MKTIGFCLLAACAVATIAPAKPVQIEEFHSAKEVLAVVPSKLLAKPIGDWTPEDIEAANNALAQHANGHVSLFTYNVQEVQRSPDEFHDGKWRIISKEQLVENIPVWHFDYLREIPDGKVTVGQEISVASTIRIAVFVRRDKKVALQIDRDACQLWQPPGAKSQEK